MRNSERTSPYPPLQVRAGILVVDGHGIALTTERGRLVAQEGGGARRLVLDRAACGLERIALVGWTGSISLEALRWLKGIGAVLVAFGPDGDLLHTSVPSGYGGLARRAQALAPSLGLDVDIARELLLGKLAGQRTNLIRLAAAGAIVAVDDEREALLHADDVATLRLCEARAAVAYWRAWQGLPMRFAPKDLVRIPARWTRHGGRASLLTGTPRGATTPHNAILNFLYALLESEARLALHVADSTRRLGCCISIRRDGIPSRSMRSNRCGGPLTRTYSTSCAIAFSRLRTSRNGRTERAGSRRPSSQNSARHFYAGGARLVPSSRGSRASFERLPPVGRA